MLWTIVGREDRDCSSTLPEQQRLHFYSSGETGLLPSKGVSAEATALGGCGRHPPPHYPPQILDLLQSVTSQGNHQWLPQAIEGAMDWMWSSLPAWTLPPCVSVTGSASIWGHMTPEGDTCSAIAPTSFAPFQEIQRLRKLSLPLMI